MEITPDQPGLLMAALQRVLRMPTVRPPLAGRSHAFHGLRGGDQQDPQRDPLREGAADLPVLGYHDVQGTAYAMT